MHLVARDGSPAPGTEAGVTFSSLFGIPTINGAGETAFQGQLAGAEVTNANSEGIWSEGGGTLHLVARRGLPAPGVGTDLRFSGLQSFILNDDGYTVFGATVSQSGLSSSADISGIWMERDGNLRLIASTGSQAPGTDAGVLFSRFSFSSFALNAAGQTAILGSLSGNGVTSANNRGIWVDGRNGLELVVRTGESLMVAPGEFRTIADLRMAVGSSNSDGRPSGFNDFGQLAFRASFTDGSSGIFVADLGIVPEPTAAALILAVTMQVVLCRLPRFGPARIRRLDRKWGVR